ncbi:Glycine/D-amino acid oxidase [Verrucomicrobium sp. GAS474]|uniref:FAD-dependent oxidoreductase n=1 Tax=Verrucomicrobium sp. GAS474 TaxID=1882831 RepID=UPI00087BCD52|nr:FAD-dependent oxidoreductase [Verrucomicrobium sp. GAS474]SDU05316.1 Glycine/D-amino acid oxidase [Verrucomicrobium sp. GAS474]
MTTSPWPSSSLGENQLLDRDLEADIVIVGAGIGGLTTAYVLAKKGLRPIVIDAVGPAGGESHATTAHLASVIDDRFANLESWIGEELTQVACQSHMAAIDFIEEIVERHRIPCDFKRLDGYLFAASDACVPALREELEAARRAGHAKAEWLEETPLPGLKGHPAIRFPNQATFNPGLYLNGLLNAVRSLGVPIYTHTRVTSWQRDRKVTLKTERGFEVTCQDVVFACNDPFIRFRYFAVECAYRSYAVAFEVEEGGKKGIDEKTDGLYWDTEDPYHYIRFAAHPDGAGRMLIVGGEDHKTGQCDAPEKAWQELENWSRLRFPFAGKVLRRWSGQILETQDGLALIGADPKEANQVFLLSGDSGMGLTHGTLGALLIGDLIEGRPNAWASVYDPGRICWKRLPHLLKDNTATLAQYSRHFPHPALPENPPPGKHGLVYQNSHGKVGRSVSPEGAVCEVHAVCPHLGGVVTWNEAEGTWDCPCHGSRFEANGKVVNGPATHPLPPHQPSP